jgi:mono/diheme cytochrome c family protein
MNPAPDAPNPDGQDTAPPGTGDPVLELHRRHMAELNEAAMTFDGVPDEERDTVQGMLDVLWREHAEPRDGFEPVPFWVACVFGALLAWGGFYVGTNSADFRRDVFDGVGRAAAGGAGGAAAPAGPDPDPQSVEELKKIGEQKFGAICASCHKPDGKGDPVQRIPPLDGSDWVAGDKATAARLSRIVLYGLSGPIEVNGQAYNGVMPSQGGVLKDYEIAGVLTYIRNSWGNKADAGGPPLITAATVRAARMQEGARKTNGTQPVTQDELLKLAPDYADPGAPVPEKKDEPKKDESPAKKDEPKADPIPAAKD